MFGDDTTLSGQVCPYNTEDLQSRILPTCCLPEVRHIDSLDGEGRLEHCVYKKDNHEKQFKKAQNRFIILAELWH